MTLSVVALDRGGFSAHGGAWFDARDRIIRLDVFPDDVIDVVIQFSSAPTEFDYEEDGIDGSEPVISGNSINVQFQTLSASGTYELVAMFASGAARTVRFQAHEAQPAWIAPITTTDDDDVDYGALG